MRLAANPIERSSRVENIVAIIALLAFAAYVIALLFLPLPMNQWIAGIICFTSDRVASGGHYYESAESLCGATFPYPPGALFLHHWVTAITGIDPLIATRLLGIFVTAIYSVLCVRVTMRLGVRFAFAACSFALANFALSVQLGKGGGMTLAGDLILISCAMGVVLLAPALERSKAAISVAVLLALAFTFKAQAAALYVGVVLFLASRPQIALRRKLFVFSCLCAGLLAVVAMLIVIPNCWGACIDVMGKHPRSLVRLAQGAFAASKYLWPFAILPVVLLALNLKRASLVGAWRGFQLLPASTAMILCLTLPYAAVQAAALMKSGGAPYNMDSIVFLAVPLIILAGKLCGLDSRAVLVIFSVVASIGLSKSAVESLREIPKGTRIIEDSRSYLTSKFPNAVVLYSGDQYCLLSKTTLTPETDVQTVWHYLTAGERVDNAMEELESQRYDLLIYPGLLTDSVPFEAYDRLVHENYVPVVDDEMPPFLRGGLFVRRPPPH